MIKFICYPKCSTCIKAEKFLKKHNISYKIINIKENNPNKQEFMEIHLKSGQPIKKLFNTSGLLYKSMELKDKIPNMTEDEQFTLLASNGMLVKRPIIILEDYAFIGFKESDWLERLGSK